jgi:hypothetical protein
LRHEKESLLEERNTGGCGAHFQRGTRFAWRTAPVSSGRNVPEE